MALKNLSVRQLRSELARRERSATQLLARRDKLQRKLDGMLAELADLGVDGASMRRGRPPGRKGKAKLGRPKGSKNRRRGRPKGRRVKRAKNKMSLADAVLRAVAPGVTVSPAEVMVGLSKSYKSKSKHLGMMVANTLAKHPEFKRIGRGQYVRKGGRKPGKAKARSKKRKASPSTKRVNKTRRAAAPAPTKTAAPSA